MAQSQANLAYDGISGQSNGNLANDGRYAYTWDALNRLVQVNHAGAGFVSAYVYDALNRRIRKSLGATFTDYLYSGWRCIEDRDSSNNLIAQYIWGIYLDELVQMQTYAATGSQSLAAGTYYPLVDLLYRTTALTDSSGNIVEAYDSDAYGNTLVFTAVGTGHSWWDPNAVQAAIPACPFIFTGQRFDAETALYYDKRRFYSPAPGRFLSRDPIGHSAGERLRICRRMSADVRDPSGMGKEHDDCESGKKAALATKFIVSLQEAMKKMEKTGCKPPKSVDCVCCDKGTGRTGGFDPETNSITLCENKMDGEDYAKVITIHEYIHAYDACQQSLGTCGYLACSEVRASAFRDSAIKKGAVGGRRRNPGLLRQA